MATSTRAAIAVLFVVTFFLGPVFVYGYNCGVTSTVNISYFEEVVYLYEGDEANVTVSVDEVLIDGTLRFVSSDLTYFALVVEEDFHLKKDDAYPVNVTVPIRGKQISISELRVLFVQDQAGPGAGEQEVGSLSVGVRRVPKLIQTLYLYILLVWLVQGYLSMGGTMELDVIWARVRRPWGILIGIFSQFIFMPAMTYYIAIVAAGSDPTIALGVILIGTCPGGWLSNVFSVLLEVDLVLSVTMTFFSSIIAMGMMPLNLFIYARSYTQGSSRLETPYSELIIQLVLLVVPCCVGIALKAKFPKFGYFCKKIVKPVSLVLVVISFGLGIAADYYVFIASPAEVWIVSIVTPLFGAFFGMGLSRIFGRDIRTSITIALETGIQNALLGRTIVGLFYPQPEADLISRTLLITAITTMIEGSVATAFYALFRYFCCRARCDRLLGTDEEEDEEKLTCAADGDATSNGKESYTMKKDEPSKTNGDACKGIDNPALELKTVIKV